MRKTFFILFILFVVQMNAQTWETQNSGILVPLFDVCFVDTLTGWAVGGSSAILKTTDGGKNWILKKIPGSSQTLHKVQFLSKTIGYVLDANDLILSTNDGGENWNIKPNEYDIGIEDLSFINQNEGWLTGYKTYSDHGIGMILHTTDGGQTFEKQVESYSSSQFGAKLYRAIKFKNDKIGWALAVDDVDPYSTTEVFRTNDGGKTWEKISEINSSTIRLKIVGDTLWCPSFGGFDRLGGSNVSIDGGYSWTRSTSELYNSTAICPIAGSNGLISYSNILKHDNRVLYTENLGKTWQPELKLDETVLAITSTGKYSWLVGTNGLIMKRFPTPTSIEHNEVTPSSFHLFQNYPNPFNNSTTISFQLSRMSDVNLSIFNYLGQLIRSFTFSSLASGTHLIQWDGNDNMGAYAASGVYICKMNVKNESERNANRFIKIIFLK